MDSLLAQESAAPLLASYGRENVKEELRRAIGRGSVAAAALIEEARKSLSERFRPTLQPVINATGVLLHTNLGRAPLSSEARAAIDQNAAGYSTLEYEPESGGRGRRQDH